MLSFLIHFSLDLVSPWSMCITIVDLCCEMERIVNCAFVFAFSDIHM
jgi:hypothetical protein